MKRAGVASLAEIDELLESAVHEHRLAGLILLNTAFTRASAPRTRDEEERERIAAFYLAAVRRGRVNNWDLVDASAEFVLGEYLYDRSRLVLVELAESEHLWWRRVTIVSTFGFIKHGDASTTLELAALLLDDREDLNLKAVGWMLREVGKRVDSELLIGFLNEHAGLMHRTMLSYATEHLDAAMRAMYRALTRSSADTHRKLP